MEAVLTPELANVKQGKGYRVGTIKRTDGLVREDELCGYFDGLNTAINYIREEMPTARRSQNSEGGVGGGFHSFDDYGQAIDTFLNTPSKVREFTPSDAYLVQESTSGSDVVFDVTGEFLDIGRFLGGEPECFGVTTNGKPSVWRVNIYINMTHAGFVHKDTLNERGRRIQRLVDWLESQNIRTAVLAIDSDTTEHVEIVVKSFDEGLDINDIAVVSHGDFFRRILFRFKEYSETWSPGYGNAAHLGDWISNNPILPEFNTELNIFVDSINNSAMEQDFEQVETWVQERIAEPGSEPDERFTILCGKGRYGVRKNGQQKTSKYPLGGGGISYHLDSGSITYQDGDFIQDIQRMQRQLEENQRLQMNQQHSGRSQGDIEYMIRQLVKEEALRNKKGW